MAGRVLSKGLIIFEQSLIIPFFRFFSLTLSLFSFFAFTPFIFLPRSRSFFPRWLVRANQARAVVVCSEGRCDLGNDFR